jgi:uncharacterized membrane protein YoaT (DUF817 family)
VALWRCRAHVSVGAERYQLPLSVAFLLIGLFLWFAENGATFLDAWNYPGQIDVWQRPESTYLGMVNSLMKLAATR